MSSEVRPVATPNRPAIDAVVLDLGNVLVGWDPYLPFAGSMSREEWQRFATEIDFPLLNAMTDRGVPIAEVVALAARKGPALGDALRGYYDNFERSLTGPVPGVAEIVDELRAAGLRLVGLTNWSAETFHHAEGAAPAIARLDAVVVSGRERLIKPDAAIFRRLAERYDLVPERTVFVDDSSPNTDAAAALGFVTVLFTSAPRLRRELQRLGILEA
ncbi:HAD family hydrolase [Tessaracoccus oleiagri]|uniref:HAD family hydrolase n=1 Tax=Tessaracoccus oleiagri TaxID=686624 RepID=UPI000B874453|nr:HAD family phosphatase [Tessaracoccus oleiagri]